MANVLNSQGIADQYFEWVRREGKKFPFIPCLATVLYRPTADTASIQYRDLICKDAERLGLQTRSFEPANIVQLQDSLSQANSDTAVHGIMVLYPLRCEIPDENLMDLVSPFKDVEGLHSINLGYLVKFKKFLDEAKQLKCIVPATAKAVVKTLQHHPEIPLEGAFATIVNNSMRVGKPLGLMLENLGATVVTCYHLTRPHDMEKCIRQADILVTAVPDPAFHIDPAWVKKGAAVIDVSHQGNIDSASLAEKASYLTSPENRIGKVTRAMTLVNLIYCARYKGLLW